MADQQLASFKRVSFRVRDAGAEVGRRSVLHEYPYRDDPYGEDLGRAARGFSLTAIFLGEDAESELQMLIDALEAPGPGTLDHPWRGRHLVQLEGKARIRYPQAMGGLIEVDLTFVEAGQNLEPDASDDTDAQLEAAADDAQQAAEGAFADDWLGEIAGLAEEAAAMVEEVCAQLESYLGPVDAALAKIDRIINAVQRIINAPLALVGRIQGRIQSLVGKLKNPFSGISSWRKLLRGDVLHPYQTMIPNASYVAGSAKPAWAVAAGAGSGQPGAGGSGGSGGGDVGGVAQNPYRSSGALPPMPPAMSALVRRTLIIEAARSLPGIEFSSKAEVQVAREQLLDALNAELQTVPDTLYPPMQALRLAVANTLAARTAAAADLDLITTHSTLPALVVAYQATGGVDAASDLVARNGVRHPGFVPAGNLEVLRHG
ncbi:hypothetical protein CEK28_04880 [Xenophilus sp. AP218F]|nr:hypothetical protein CEK28_04880 [Xenophilus sp. AP218F]